MQTGPSAQINVCMWSRAKDLEPQNQSTSLVRLNTEPVFALFSMHTEPFIYSFPKGFIMGYYVKSILRKQCNTFLLNIIVPDKTNNTKCSFPVFKFNRTAKQKLCNTMHLFLSNYIISCNFCCCRLAMSVQRTVLV